MNVLQIANGYHTQKLYDSLFSALEKANINNIVYVPVNTKNSFVASNTYQYKLIVSPCFSDIDRLLFYTKQQKIFKDIIAKINIESLNLIHAHTLFSGGCAAYRLKKKYGIPYVVAVRNTDLNVFMKYMIHLRRLGLSILRNSSHIVFLSPVYRDRMISKYIPNSDKGYILSKTSIIPNGIDNFWLNNINFKIRPNNSGQIKLIYAGTVDTNKGIDLLIKACRELIQQGYKVTLCIAGKIVEEKYRKLIKSNSFVQYLGFLSKEGLLPYMREYDIFVMPSRTETFGLAYAEALSQGLPVIYTRGEGFDGQFEEGCVGYSVPKNDVKALCSVILNVYKNYARISGNCSECVKKFNWNEIVDRYSLIYNNIIKNSQKSRTM